MFVDDYIEADLVAAQWGSCKLSTTIETKMAE